jgi:adenylylsulfate kinase
MSWVVWITGLPGSGKSTVSMAVKRKVPDAVILRMDELRKVITPEPTYSDEEREYVYRAIVFSAHTLYKTGHNVIIDATGNKKSWRTLSRQLIPEFYEVYVRCPLEVCREREKARIETHSAPRGVYEKGEKGHPVPGIQTPYEEPERPEVIIDTDRESPSSAAEKIVRSLRMSGNG